MENEFQLGVVNKYKLGFLILATIFFALSLVIPSSVSADATVSPGTTIQSVVNSASGTITVKSGTYNERITVNKQITLQCEGTCVVKGFIVGGSGAVIRGFEITYKDDTSKYGIDITGSNCVVENNYIHDTYHDGIRLMNSSSSCTVKNNRIVRASQSAIQVRGMSHTIDGNDVSATIQYPGGDPSIEGADADCFRYFGTGHLFKNNYCHDITFGPQPNGGNNVDPHIDGFQTWGDPGYGSSTHDIIFDGNTIIGFGRGTDAANKGIQLGGGTVIATNLTFRNNIFKTTLGMLCSTLAQGLVIDHNTFVGDKTDDGSWAINANRCDNPKITNNIFAYHLNGAGHIQGSPYTASNNCIWKSGNPVSNPGDVRADPKFVNEATNDFRLQSGSPCAGKGANPTLQTPVILTSGDVNGDGSVNFIDIGVLIDTYGKSVSTYPKSDLNNDGVINIVDIGIVISSYGK